MGTFIQILLLIFIASFLVLQKKGGLGDLLGHRRKIILDSCALIDGRIVELVKSGFVADQLVIPQFVLNELQLLADGNDSHKRERARFGLDIAHELQDAAFNANVLIDRTVFADIPTTDDKLISLSKKLQGYLYTTDYNLAKVAAIEAVGVLNINELSQALRPIALPGETLKIKIVQKGSNPNQGVGYLDDGTMIVVEGAARFAGKIVDVTVTRMHQTVAGKMVFGHIVEMNRPVQQPKQQLSADKAKVIEQAQVPPRATPRPRASTRRSATAAPAQAQQTKSVLQRLKAEPNAAQAPAPRRSSRLMQ